MFNRFRNRFFPNTLAGIDDEHFLEILNKAVDYGETGKIVLFPNIIWLAASNGCNLRCVMCPGHEKKDNIYMTREEVEMLLSPIQGKTSSPYWGETTSLDLTSGEPMINPDIGDILQLFKRRFPQATTTLFTNATYAVSGKIKTAVQNIDFLSISVDGATKAVFEDIRRGSNFDKIISNIKDMMCCRRESGLSDEKVQIGFVAMATNLHELTSVISLAHDLRIRKVFAQKVETRGELSKAYDPLKYDLENLPIESTKQYLIDAQKIAKKLGISLTLSSNLTDLMQTSSDVKGNNQPLLGKQKFLKGNDKFSSSVSMCNVLWRTSPFIRKTKSGIYPEVVCCHMPNGALATMENNLTLRGKSIVDIFNSHDYWILRQNLLNGSLAEGACKGCQYSEFKQWTMEDKVSLAEVISRIDKKNYQ
jgi:MoaA/NifB/PqqE/SkfB family radical SAM enzyme